MTDQPDRPGRSGAASGGGRRCPICGKPAKQDTRPFCSRRCADVDLSRWLGGAYRIPINVPDEDESADRHATDAGPEEDGR